MRFSLITSFAVVLASTVTCAHVEDGLSQQSEPAIASTEVSTETLTAPSPSSILEESTAALPETSTSSTSSPPEISSIEPSRTTSSNPSTTDKCTSGTESATPALVSVSMPFVLPSGAVGGRIYAFSGSISMVWRRCSMPTQGA